MSDLGRTCTQSYNDWLNKHDAETRKDAIRKFAEWLRTKCHVDVSEYLEWYGKEQNGL